MLRASERAVTSNYAASMDPKLNVVMTGGRDDGCSILEGVAHAATVAGLQLGRFSTTPPPFDAPFADESAARGTAQEPDSADRLPEPARSSRPTDRLTGPSKPSLVRALPLPLKWKLLVA